MDNTTAMDVMNMLAASIGTPRLVTEGTVVRVMRGFADALEKASPELREVMARAFAMFLAVTFEVAAKTALEGMLAQPSPETTDHEEEDDGLD